MTRKTILCVLILVFLSTFIVSVAAYGKDAAPTYTKGQKVQVEWKGTWYASTILEVGSGANAGKYKIHYDGWGSEWDEWVPPSRIKAK